MKSVLEIFELMIENQKRALNTISLVPSESWFPFYSKMPFLLDAYHRYFFNDNLDPNGWDFRGAQNLAEIEVDVAIPLIKQLTKAKYVDLRSLSGLHLMSIVLAGLANNGDTILCVSPELGGHNSTASIARRLGLTVKYIEGAQLALNFEALASAVEKHRPHLIYLDQGHGLFPFDISKIAETVHAFDQTCIIHVDASHWMGLILGEVIPNPLEQGADSFGGSTHKTFPGPHKAIFATSNAEVFDRFNEMQYSMVSNHNFAAVISLAICLSEFSNGQGKEYSRSVVDNAKLLGRLLDESGVDVVGKERGYSGGHQLWVRSESASMPAMQVSDLLYELGINVNVLGDLPSIPEPALRLGVAEATYTGFGQEEITALGEIIAGIINGDSIDCHQDKVRNLCERRNEYVYKTFLSKELLEKTDSLWSLFRYGLADKAGY